MKRMYDCPNCLGHGVLNEYAFSTEIEVCPDCLGSGEVLATPQEARLLWGEAAITSRPVRRTKKRVDP